MQALTALHDILEPPAAHLHLQLTPQRKIQSRAAVNAVDASSIRAHLMHECTGSAPPCMRMSVMQAEALHAYRSWS